MHFKKKFSHRVQRFGQWLKKLLILGRTDWRLASDQCSPPRLTQSQRDALQPKFDVNAIKPRAVSAAAVQARKMAPAPEPSPREVSADAPVAVEPASLEQPPAVFSPAIPAVPPPAAEPEVRRRRKRGAKHRGISPLAAFSAQESSELRGLAAKIFGKNGE